MMGFALVQTNTKLHYTRLSVELVDLKKRMLDGGGGGISINRRVQVQARSKGIGMFVE